MRLPSHAINCGNSTWSNTHSTDESIVSPVYVVNGATVSLVFVVIKLVLISTAWRISNTGSSLAHASASTAVDHMNFRR